MALLPKKQIEQVEIFVNGFKYQVHNYSKYRF